ncbi:MAG: hypothetical protein JSR45_04510 [Proteobacteria bacterium]|nr:hypothetical protein [Pseudomonadota bacterium]
MDNSPIAPVSPLMVPARIYPIAPIAPRPEAAGADSRPVKAALPQGVGTRVDISA